jgi:hypothetical protein
MSTSEYLDTKQAANRIGLGESTLEKMRMNGIGPDYIKATSRRILYSVTDLEAFMASRKQSTKAAAA